MADETDSDGNRRSQKPKAAQLVRNAKQQFTELIGKPVDSVLGIQRDDDGGWYVTLQIVELERVPSSTDVLGSYSIELDEDGDLVGYRRTRRYFRSQADEG